MSQSLTGENSIRNVAFALSMPAPLGTVIRWSSTQLGGGVS